MSIRTDGYVYVELNHLSKRLPFDDAELRGEFIRQVNEAVGTTVPEDAITRRSFRLEVLADSPQALKSFKATLDWFCETVRSHPGDHAED